MKYIIVDYMVKYNNEIFKFHFVSYNNTHQVDNQWNHLDTIVLFILTRTPSTVPETQVSTVVF